MNTDSLFEKYKIPLIFSLVGLIFLGVGVLVFKVFLEDGQEIEISSGSKSTGSISAELPQKIAVDIAGAVQKPGLYELPADSRINDLLILAGGLSAQADRDWVAKNLNLAQKLVDGTKVYIPSESERVKEQESKSSAVLGIAEKININTATQKELESLWGIGPATAEKIIAGRPYQNINELVTRKIVKSNVWEAIKEKISVY